MKLKLLSLLALLALISCSSSKSIDDEQVEMEQEAVGLEDENSYESEESVDEQSYSENTIEEKDETQVANSMPELSDEEELYTVQKGDTLMLIAFKKYGKYTMWKEIQALNPQLSSLGTLQEGTEIKLRKPAEEFNWRPDGNPYLIKRNDTLRKISNNVYETEDNWKHLYEHNNQLITDPNVIYAGFTIYYLDAELLNRDPASGVTETAPVEETQEQVQMDAPYEKEPKVEEVSEPVQEVAQADTTEENVDAEMMADEDPEALEFDQE